jgi:hypothetical protein
MSFELLSERVLSEEELALIDKMIPLLGSGRDRRECLRLMGLSGAVLVGSFFAIRPARAYVPLLIRSVAVLGRIALRSAIPATIVVANTTAEAARGPIAVEHKEPTGLTVDQSSVYVDIPPKIERTFRHSGFRARMVGTNEYIASSDQNSEEDEFEVVE